ncbi:hypothetical protein MYX07_05845 [Patescibacteria group bacterium AH-259-L07]|nr:hypothetical protein [Patescibacteria group bacterium AH-259-L07]
MTSDYVLQQKALVKKLEDSFIQGVHKSSIVDIQQDYANNDQICLTSVVFIPDAISNKIIQNVIDPLEQIEPYHYYYPTESMHLTIKNIRTIHKPPLFTKLEINRVSELFNKIISKFPIFEFYVEDILAFPTSLSVMAYSNDTFQRLVLELDKGLNEIGVPDNKRYLSNSVFWGNITVCRFVKNPGEQFVAAVNKMRNLKIGKFRVENVNLITCNAVCYSKSREIIAKYKLKEFALKE